MTAFAIPQEREHRRLEDIQLPKFTLLQKAQNLAYAGIGSFAGKGIITALYILVFIARYRLFGRTFTLSGVWNNWPLTLQLPARLSFIHVGGPGGLGTWFVAKWPEIQFVALRAVPIGVIAVAFILLVLNKGAGKRITWFDHMTKALHDRLPIFSSRLQPERTTFWQYAFLFPVMLVAAIPGVLAGSIIVFGGLALAHRYQLPFIGDVLQNTVVQVAVLGVSAHLAFASKVVMRPAQDLSEHFLETRLDLTYDGVEHLPERPASELTWKEKAAAVEAITEAGRSFKPPRWYVPSFQLLYSAMLALEWDVAEKSRFARFFMPALLAFAIGLAILGLYWGNWFPSHGGWLA